MDHSRTAWRPTLSVPEAEVEAMVWGHLDRLVGCPNDVGARRETQRLPLRLSALCSWQCSPASLMGPQGCF